MGALAFTIGGGVTAPAVQVGSWVDPHAVNVRLGCHLRIEAFRIQRRCSKWHTCIAKNQD
jgi:hypothetical protein